jgi:5,10-methylenetetrahydromethanopterin reductase
MTRKLALGILLYADYSLAELAELGTLCEELGYQMFWYTDVRFGRECYLGLASVAAVTKRLRLGPGVSDPYTRHPAMTASTIATFDEMCNGRALLGLGVGGQGFPELGITRKLPVAALRETVESVRALLRGERVDLDGKVISLNNGKLTFQPPRDSVPIYFATHGAQVSKLAGKLADGVLIANTLLPNMLSFYVDQIQDGMHTVGRTMDEFDLGLRIEACISNNYEAAFNVMRKRMAARLIGQYPHWDYLKELGVTLPKEFVDIAQKKDDSLAGDAAPFMPREVVDYTVLAGDAARCAEQLAGAVRPEVRSITIRPHAAPGESVKDVIRAFAEEVMPRVEKLVAERDSGI